MNETDYITPAQAVARAKRMGIPLTNVTVRAWCERYGIGHQIGGKGGKWVVYPRKFRELLRGQNKASRRKRLNKSDQSPLQEAC